MAPSVGISAGTAPGGLVAVEELLIPCPGRAAIPWMLWLWGSLFPPTLLPIVPPAGWVRPGDHPQGGGCSGVTGVLGLSQPIPGQPQAASCLHGGLVLSRAGAPSGLRATEQPRCHLLQEPPKPVVHSARPPPGGREARPPGPADEPPTGHVRGAGGPRQELLPSSHRHDQLPPQGARERPAGEGELCPASGANTAPEGQPWPGSWCPVSLPRTQPYNCGPNCSQAVG